MALRVLARIVSPVYARETFSLMSVDPSQFWPPDFSWPPEIEIRVAGPEDAAALDGLWVPPSPENVALFKKRMEAGYVCLTAWHQKKIVGIMWISDCGDDEVLTGLQIRTRPGSAYVLDLHVSPPHRGKRIGPALIAFAIAEGKQRGFRKGYIFVSSMNAPMLRLATALFGAQKVGYIRTTWVFRRPFSSWQVRELSGRGGVLLL